MSGWVLKASYSPVGFPAVAASAFDASQSPGRSLYPPMLPKLTITWVFNTIALFIAIWILSGLSYGSDWWALLIAGLVFTLVNTFLKPLLAVLSIPFIIVTFGIFYFLINVLMLYLTHWIVPQFTIASFWWAALAAIIVSAVNGILHMFFGRPRDFGTRPATVGRDGVV